MTNAINVLLQIHTKLSNLPIAFRERICEDCNWSIPTFYRKTRLKDNQQDGRMMPALSNAEREMIIARTRELYEQLGEELEQYK